MKRKFSKFRLYCGKWLIVLLLFTGLSNTILAQNIDFGLACPNADFDLPNQVAGAPVSIPAITAINAPSGAPTITIQSISVDGLGVLPGPYTSPFLLNLGPLTTDITMTINPGNVTFSTPAGGVNPLGAGQVIHFTLRATSGATQCDRNYNVKVVAPVDLMVVLDGSGSMAWGYDGNFSPPAGLRRWDGLLTGVGVLKTSIGGIGLLSNDSLGLRLFSSAVITPGAPFNGSSLVGMSANFNQLDAPGILGPNPPGGNTALGDGILSGTNMLHPGPSVQKSMIVFSDGQQNVGDMVKVINPDAYRVTNSNKSLSDGDKIDIYTIGLGTSGSLPATMNEIANANNGAYLGADAGADFSGFFTMQFANIFRGRSPQIIDIKKGTFPVVTGDNPATVQQSFSVNRGASSLIVTMLVPNNFEARFTSLMRDSVNLIQFAQQRSGPGYMSLVLRDTLRKSGDWSVSAQLGTFLKEPLPYTIMVMADDHALNAKYALNKGAFKVGEVVNPRVTLYRNGKPLNNASVQAIFVRPGDDINDLIARAQVSAPTSPDDSATIDAAKLAVLMQDSAFVNKIKGQEQIVNLSFNTADSTFTGSFNGLTVAGVYQVIFITTATDSSLGKIQRFHQKSFYVRFPDIDLPNSNVILTIDSLTGNSILTARFVTSQGKFLGPGWKSVIDIDAGGLGIQKIDDVGDGTYRIFFDGKLEGNGVITIFNDTIFNGNLPDIGEGSGGPGGDGGEFWKQWWFWLLVVIAIIIIILLLRRN